MVRTTLAVVLLALLCGCGGATKPPLQPDDDNATAPPGDAGVD